MANIKTNIWAVIGFIIVHKFSEVWSENYYAAVVEYYYDQNAHMDSTKLMNNNLDEFINIIQKFGQLEPRDLKRIIVFPECGLTKEFIQNPKLFVHVPDPDYNNRDFRDSPVLQRISSAANLTNTWVVINVMENNGTDKYNTDVVFASNGTIAARYRKFNLFGEPLNKTSKPEVVSFNTDFGVTFGIFTCFDILFSTPALTLVREKKIKHFIFPTDWYSELPFLTAVQYQMAWSWTNNVTLLAAGLGFSSVGSTGSGIYLGKRGPLKYYQTTHSHETKLIYSILDSVDLGFSSNSNISTIPTRVNSLTVEPTSYHTDLFLKIESLYPYTTRLIEPNDCALPMNFDSMKDNTVECSKDITEKLCNRGLCCTFKVSTKFQLCVDGTEACDVDSIHQDDFSLSVHRLAVLDGVRSFGVATGGVQTCAVVSCANADLLSCGVTSDQQHSNPYFEKNKIKFRIVRRFISEVYIEGKFLLQEGNKENFITPNILLGHGSSNGINNQFGALEPATSFIVNQNGDTFFQFKPSNYRDTPVGTAGIWSRVYNRDGQPASSSVMHKLSFFLLIASLYICEH